MKRLASGVRLENFCLAGRIKATDATCVSTSGTLHLFGWDIDLSGRSIFCNHYKLDNSVILYDIQSLFKRDDNVIAIVLLLFRAAF